LARSQPCDSSYQICGAPCATKDLPENAAGEVLVELTFKPLELNPNMPPEGERAIEHLMRKYGGAAEDVAAGTRSLRPGFPHREKTKPS
jgi:hypothetical protein